ncbi:MAG: hypothetical protein E7630_05540 [Ruminococcaceae bacterium]|nr:hypothetical protein [Oscillospiraceae bacterium]
MIKGTHRHMVILKNTESPLFEEAYFILRDRAEPNDRPDDMVAEANRIIAANVLPPAQKPKREILWRILFFLAGLLAGGVGAALLSLVA